MLLPTNVHIIIS